MPCGQCCWIPVSLHTPLQGSRHSSSADKPAPLSSRSLPQGCLTLCWVSSAAAAPGDLAGPQGWTETVLDVFPVREQGLCSNWWLAKAVVKAEGLSHSVALLQKTHVCPGCVLAHVGFVTTGAQEQSVLLPEQRHDHCRLHRVTGLFLSH